MIKIHGTFFAGCSTNGYGKEMHAHNIATTATKYNQAVR